MNDIPPLGKKKARFIRGLPALGKYTLSLPSSPKALSYVGGPRFLGPMLNDKYGCCTISAIGHIIQAWTSLTRLNETIIPDETILDCYVKWCGYVRGDRNTDLGGVATDVLRSWYNETIDSHVLNGFAAIRPGNRSTVRDAIYLFGGAYVGLQLPLTAQNDVWDVSPDDPLKGNKAPGSWGGHAIPLVEPYDPDGLTCITWGKEKKLSWSFLDAYMDEGYGLLSRDWIDASGRAPPGFDFETLELDMESIRGT